MSFNSDVLANSLEISLTNGKDFTLPEIDIDGPEYQLPDTSEDIAINPISINDLTQGTLTGTGVFDKLMAAAKAHLKEEYEKNRITGQDYTKAYIALIDRSMATAASFLLGKDQAYWQAVLARAQAQSAAVALVTARVQLLTAKFEAYMAQFQSFNAEATYALTKLKLATEDASYGNALAQRDNLVKQAALIDEQVEVQRAQTLDTRRDGASVNGQVGKQKALIDQQITSYKRDAEVKAGKLFVDAWITQKTIDEGLVAPTGFTNNSLDRVLSNIKINNDLD